MLLAKLLKKDVADVKQELQQLHRHGIIEYQPQKDSPQLFFYRDRVRTEELSIKTRSYLNRKEKFTARVKDMIRYIVSETRCRSKNKSSCYSNGKFEFDYNSPKSPRSSTSKNI